VTGYTAAVNTSFYFGGNTFGQNFHNISKCQKDWNTNLVKLIATAFVTGSTLLATNLPEPPNQPKVPNVEEKSVPSTAAVAQKYNNTLAAYTEKLSQYNKFLPSLKRHITQAESLIFYIASRLIVKINDARGWNNPAVLKTDLQLLLVEL
jgi:hypothetical protein